MATIYMLALCLWREARGEPIEGKAAVADVILTRAADRRWPKTITGVITQRRQFSAFNSDDPNVTKYPDPAGRNLTDWRAFVDCLAVAATAIDQGPTGSANHYHAASIARPRWAAKMQPMGRIGRHIFYLDQGTD